MNKVVWVSVAGLLWLVQTACAAEFYVDPRLGDASNDGSREKPWKSLQDVVNRGLIESRQWSQLPYGPSSSLVPRNAGAPVKAGDTIYLRAGYHGALDIQGHYNLGHITIAAQEGHTPKFCRIRIRSSSHWTLRGLHISPEFASEHEAGTLIDLDSHGFRGPVSQIIVEGCTAFSVRDATKWTVQDWNDRAWNAIDVDGHEMTVRNCMFRNVNFGISVSAAHSLISGNTVENFAGDGMRGLGDYSTFEYNTVKNCYDVNQNHDDGFQSWSVGKDGRVGRGEVRGIVLRGNIIVNYEDPEQPHRGALQGIGCFDGMFVDWVIENNVVIVDHYHGITLGGARNCRIVNNTVVDIAPGRPGPAWIQIGRHKNGTPSADCIVRNNLTTSISLDSGAAMDHNLVVKDPELFFVDIQNHDLRLRADCAAVDAGNSELAPELDVARNRRPLGAGVDVGAYESW